MENKITESMYNLTAKLMLASDKREMLGIVNEFMELAKRFEEKESYEKERKTESYVLQFTKQEISQMATTFKKEFIANGLTAHVIKRTSGKNTFLYEIRYRSNGYKIETSSTNLAMAKHKFLEKTKPENIGNYYIGKTNNLVPQNFERFARYYFEKFRKNRVAENTYQKDLSRLNVHVIPALGKMDIKKITPSDCQKLLDKLTGQQKFKTAVEIYNLLSCIFKNAYAHDLIVKSPLAIIQKPKYDQENGKALSKDEETKLLTALNGSIYAVPIALGLFCGLRPNEVKTAKIDGLFIVAVNSKRHSRKVEYKRIPITDKLKPFLLDGIPKIPNENATRKAFKNILPNHKLYDLRTTFYSRCKECGVELYALDEFMGHSLGKIGKAYTDLSNEYLLKEGKKLVY